MIIPVRCYTCGMPIADKYNYFIKKTKAEKIKKNIPLNKTVYFNKENTKKTIEGNILDEMEFDRICCRNIFLTHVDQK